uniref:Conserved arthropod protein n=1 Tax=Argas monolakensis TaxID=34602 RepID=Q09JI6_ARGMO|nr:conserved arthropod protein [Argas monolakensis]
MQSLKVVARSALAGVRAASGTASSSTSRRMKYPYTWTAKVALFPHRFMFENVWLIRYSIPAIILTFIFYVVPVHRAVNSPSAIAAHEEFMRKQAEAEAEHHH